MQFLAMRQHAQNYLKDPQLDIYSLIEYRIKRLESEGNVSLY